MRLANSNKPCRCSANNQDWRIGSSKIGTIFVDATHAAKTGARTGTQTVVRGLLWGLSKSGVNPQIMGWSKWRHGLLPLNRTQNGRLGVVQGIEGVRSKSPAGAWLVLPEIIYGNRALRVIDRARSRKMRVAAIFHDAIPLSHPDLTRPAAVEHHPEYMRTLCRTDLVIAVSDSAAEQFRAFAQRNAQRLPPLSVCRLSGELVGKKRSSAKEVDFSGPVKILCVSTLDPRKNHKTLLEAFDLACTAISSPAELHLVGDRYEDAELIVDLVKRAAARNRSVTWHGRATDDQLSEYYRDCDFSVYPSLVEGFGLPIVESLWNRRPCICANFGEMAEIAKEGGCVTCDVRDPLQLSEAMVALATQPALRKKLINEIERREPRTWIDYAVEICEKLGKAS
jgi:glycosyltransferase involved in cell wall biosynthesis